MTDRYPVRDGKPIGEIYIYRFPERCPNDFLHSHPNPSRDRFVVYNSYNGNPSLCKWEDNVFWYNDGDNTWHVLLNAEYWFRIPTVKEMYEETNREEAQ